MDPFVPADAFSGPFSGRKRASERKETMKTSNRKETSDNFVHSISTFPHTHTHITVLLPVMLLLIPRL
jgi:hypothetical protein